MKNPPLDIQPGDIIVAYLAHPNVYGDGKGGTEERDMIRLQVDEISRLGISGRGSDVEGLIVPHATKEYERLGTGDKPEFFPWSTIQRISLMYTFAQYEAIWDKEGDTPR